MKPRSRLGAALFRLAPAMVIGLPLLFGATLVTVTPPAAAAVDVGRDARLKYFDGKFAEADEAIANAPEEVRNDPALRQQLADAALKWAKRQAETSKRPGLVAARANLAEVFRLEPTNTKASEQALSVSEHLVRISLAAEEKGSAKKEASWGIAHGEAVLKGGIESLAVRTSLASLYSDRAALGHVVQEFDIVVADYTRGAELLAGTAEETSDAVGTLSRAARICFDLASFVHENRPVDEETRDEEAIKQAVEYARRACESKDAQTKHFTTHLVALRQAKRMGIEDDLGRPFMREMGDGLKRIELMEPKAAGWKRLAKTDDYDIIFERKIEGDDTSVQVMIKEYSKGATFGGKAFGDVEGMTKLRHESKRESEFGEVQKEIKPEKVDIGKKGAEAWHWEVVGKHTDNRRPKRMAEWLWKPSKKAKYVYFVRMIDWRAVTNLDEPDLTTFIDYALGTAQQEEDDKGKKGKKKPKKKKKKKGDDDD